MDASTRHLANAPPHWARAMLSEIAVSIRQGRACGRYSRHPPGILHLRPMNITRDGQLDVSDSRFIDEVYASEFPRLVFGDVLFNNTNSRELVGKTTTIDAEEGWTFSNHMTLLRFPRVISHRFMAHQLHFFWMIGAFKPLLKQYVNQASISIKVLRNFSVVLPPPLEQSRIAERIDLLLAHVRKAAALLDSSQIKSESYIRAVLRAATSGMLSSPEGEHSYVTEESTLGDRESKQADIPEVWDLGLFGRRANLRGSSGGGMPRGWSLIRVDEAGETQLGLQRQPERHAGDNLRPYLRVANVLDNKINFEDVKYMNFEPSEYMRYQLRSGDILLNEGQSLSLVGRPAMFRGEVEEVCFQNTLIRFRAYDDVDAEFALIVFRHYFYTGRFSEVARWSTNIAHLGLRRFSALPFPLPPMEEQRQICATTRELLDGVAQQVEAIPKLFDRLESLRFAILKRAFSGELTETESTGGDADRLIANLRTAAAEDRVRYRSGLRQRARSRSDHSPERNEEHELSLIDIVVEAGGRLTTRDLFERSTYDESSIDDFYSVLAQGVRDGRIREGERAAAETPSSLGPQSVVELVK